MKSWIFLSIILFFGWQNSHAQKPLATAQPTQKLSFKSGNGNNGSAVAYNDVHNVYYIAIAGNADFPLEALSREGVVLQSSNTGYDLRGLWYNPYTKRVEGNAYNGGIYAQDIDSRGYPRGAAYQVLNDNFRPDAQSVASYDGKKALYYYHKEKVSVVKLKDHQLHKEVKLEAPADANYSTYSMLYTGVKGYELGLLEVKSGQVHLFNKKGAFTGRVNVPSELPLPGAFRLSYANGMMWVYDVNERTWHGLKLFNK